MKEHTFQTGRKQSRLRNSTGEGPEVAKKVSLWFEELPTGEARVSGLERGEWKVRGRETRFYSACKEKPRKVFKQGNGISYVLRRPLWKEKKKNSCG